MNFSQAIQIRWGFLLCAVSLRREMVTSVLIQSTTARTQIILNGLSYNLVLQVDRSLKRLLVTSSVCLT